MDQVIDKINKSLSLQPGFNKLHNEDIQIVTEAKKQYESALPLFIEVSRRRGGSAEAYYHMACIYARQGRVSEAIKCLDKAIEYGFNRMDFIEKDSDLKNIRGDGGYQLLVKG